MRVLLISHSSALNGAQRSLLDLALGLRSCGVEAVVTTPEVGPLRALLLDEGFDARILPCRNWVHSRSAYNWHRKWLIAKMQARRASKWVAQGGFDLIHTNTVVTPVGAMIARRVGLPHVWHVREGMPPKKNFFYMPFSKVGQFIEDTTRLMIGISDHTCEGMKAFCPAERIRRVYNGPIGEDSANAPLPALALAPDRPLRLLCVGRSGPAKGHDVAAKALTQLRKKGVDATLTIAGKISPEFKRELEALAPEGLNIAGFNPKPETFYRTNDILIMASQKEAFGRVTVEAMALGCLVVGTNSGGTPEILSHERTGMLFEPGDVDGLTAQILRLQSDGELAQNIRKEAHADAFVRFTRERYARDVAALYREAVTGG